MINQEGNTFSNNNLMYRPHLIMKHYIILIIQYTITGVFFLKYSATLK